MSEQIKNQAEDCPTDLYRYFDENGELLYVGVSLNSVARAAQHKHQSHWYDNFCSMTRQTFPTRQEALAAETLAIQAENPKHNIRKVSAASDDDHWKSRAQKEHEQLTRSVVYKPMYNSEEAANALGVSTSRIRTWVNDGRLGHVKFGSRTMITGWQIIDFLEWAEKTHSKNQEGA